MGINTSIVQSSSLTGGTIVTPTTTGQSINYLVEAAFQESDGTAVTLPYYNSANPAVPFSGPRNSGTPQNTQRLQTVNLQIKASTPATTGSQVTPTPDSGFVGLYVITVAFGQTTIVNANIATLPTAPFIQYKLPSLRPGFSSVWVSTAGTATFTVPAGVTVVDVEVWSGGGGSGGTTGAGGASQGGGGGGYARGLVSVTPGQVITVTVGVGGTAGTSAPTNGGNGGASSFGTSITCSGAGGGGAATTGVTAFSANGGSATGGTLNVPGGPAGAAFAIASGVVAVSQGGSAFGTPQNHLGATGALANGVAGLFPGGGATGALNGGVGAAGASGLVIVRY
jgi:hypothetical protein